MSKYTTLRRRIRFIARQAESAPPTDDTLDSISREACHALRDLDELDTDPATVHDLKPVTLRLVEDEKGADAV